MKPTNVNILGVDYTIEYTDRPSDVDMYKRESLWGQVDFWTRTIRIYYNNRGIQEVWHTIIHEVLHAICDQLHLTCFKGNCSNEKIAHNELDIIATTLLDVFVRNNWIELEETYEKETK